MSMLSRTLRLLLLSLCLPLAACDSGSSDGGSANVDCERYYGEEAAGGTFSATVDGAPASFSCVTAVDQSAVFDALDITGHIHPGSRPNVDDAYVDVTFINPAVGTFPFDAEPGQTTIASGQYSPEASLESFNAEAGTFTISELTDTRVRGSFSFTTEDGTEVTGGAFDLTYFTVVL